MPTDPLIFVSMPGLRLRDLEHMPRLRALANAGAACELIPTFPCVTSPVQATMLSGRTPQEHGIIGNGFYFRERGEVELWTGRNGLIEGDQVFDTLAARGITQAAWLTQNIKDAAADYIVTPEPIHHPDGRMDLWCYSMPDGLYEKLLTDLGHFPLMNYWGPGANIKSTEWTINAALWLIQRQRPRFNHIYIPHLDYAAQKHGPNSDEQMTACRDADEQIGRLIDGVAALGLRDAAYLIVSEYALTEVDRVIYPNRILRDAGYAKIADGEDGEHLDLAGSIAFAVVDHQFAHVYVRDPAEIDAVAGIFEGMDGIADVAIGDDRRRLYVDHPRSGEVVVVCEPDTWLAYYWWNDDAKAPAFARTVDIHRKPGYDPVELFFDPVTKSIPLDATRVRGSHGAPAKRPDQYAACIASKTGIEHATNPVPDSDVRGMIERSLIP